MRISNGAEGRSRTDTPVKEPDFESGASTNFATPADVQVRQYTGQPVSMTSSVVIIVTDSRKPVRISGHFVQGLLMLRRDFHFDLPQELIAQYPLEDRSASRMLTMAKFSGVLDDRKFADLVELVTPGDLLIFNDTRVIPARLKGSKASGGKIELLVERVLGEQSFLAQIKSSKSPRPGSVIFIDGYDGPVLEVIDRQGVFYRLSVVPGISIDRLMQDFGHIPLPPYITRPDEALDLNRYQTVYARNDGAVAAPTAGLHFDRTMLDRLTDRGVNIAYITLHVGAGTFQPLRVDDISKHHMHSESVEVSAAVCDQIRQTRANGQRVIAVGTTVVRSLESAAQRGEIEPFNGETSIFITPGYQFRCVDALITNFHFPESTLLMLVCAFAGHQETIAAYRYAVAQRYRFFSYGDAMFLYP